MSPYANAALMLAATLAGFAVLAKLLQSLRSQRAAPTWWPVRRRGTARPQAARLQAARLQVEQACMVDGRRRLLLVRCDEQRVLLLTGGAADLVVAVLPPLPGANLPDTHLPGANLPGANLPGAGA